MSNDKVHCFDPNSPKHNEFLYGFTLHEMEHAYNLAWAMQGQIRLMGDLFFHEVGKRITSRGQIQTPGDRVYKAVRYIGKNQPKGVPVLNKRGWRSDQVLTAYHQALKGDWSWYDECAIIPIKNKPPVVPKEEHEPCLYCLVEGNDGDHESDIPFENQDWNTVSADEEIIEEVENLKRPRDDICEVPPVKSKESKIAETEEYLAEEYTDNEFLRDIMAIAYWGEVLGVFDNE